MNCRRAINLMSAYVDGELTGEEMLAIRRHMATCPECAEEHQSVVLTKRAVANLATAKPRQDFAAAIISQLNQITVPRHQRFADWLIHILRDKVSPVAAALAVSGAALVIMSAGEVDRLTPSATTEMTGAPVHQVTFVRSIDDGSGVLGSGEPLKLVADIPGMGQAGIHFASFPTQ